MSGEVLNRGRRPGFAHGDLVPLDFEASGLPLGSWPIEIGLARILPSGMIESDGRLIRPHPSWPGWLWSAESAAVHNIPREALDEAPAAEAVARWALPRLTDRAVVSDAPEFDLRWLRMVLSTTGAPFRVSVNDFDVPVARAFPDDAVRRVYRALDEMPTPHRAEADAARLARAWLAGIAP